MRRLLLLLSTAALATQGQPQTLSLTLREAQDLAMRNNPQYSAALMNAAAAQQVPLEFRSGLLPLVSGAITAVGADSGSRLAAGGLNNPVLYDRFATGLAVNQLVTDFGRTGHLVASARLKADAQSQVTETTRANVLVTATRAYYGILRARAVLTVAEQTVSARRVVAEQVEALAKNNLKSGLDLSFANVNLADGELLLSQAQNAVKASEAELAAAIGIAPPAAFVLREEPMPDALPGSVDPLLSQALRDRPELKSLRLEQSAAERFAKAEHSLIYPTVGVVGAAGVVPAHEAAVAGRYGAVGLNVNIPVFNGGLFRARQTEAELKAKAAAQNVNDYANRVARDVRVAWLNSQTALERTGLTDRLLEQARMALDLAQGRYDLGLSSIVELSQAQLNLTAAQIGSASARYEYQTQRAILEYQIGALR
jgi:outer membrane protein